MYAIKNPCVTQCSRILFRTALSLSGCLVRKQGHDRYAFSRMSTSTSAAAAPAYAPAPAASISRAGVLPTRSRIASIDVMRGLVMLIMLVDHVREAFYRHVP